jgi:tripartite ATP-independent transporter DctP family solute receptor
MEIAMALRGWLASGLLVSFLGVGILLGAGCSRPEEDGQAEIVLHAADDHEAEYPTTQGLYRMAELVSERSGGRIEIRIHHSASMGSEKETIEQTQTGGLDINRVNVNPVAQLVGAMKVLALPYVFRDEQHMHAVCDGAVGRALLDELEAKGLVGLAYYDSGQRSFYAARPLRSMADLKGLKIRVQKAEIMRDMVQAIGAVPTSMAFEEVYTGLQTGQIDGAENNFPSWVSKGHYEVAQHYLMDGHSRAPEVILFSKVVWDSLSADDRELIRQAAVDSVPHQRQLWDQRVEQAVAKAEQAGCTIIRDVDREPFREAMKPVWTKHGAGLEPWIDRIQGVK